jgi:hypothetical protein
MLREYAMVAVWIQITSAIDSNFVFIGNRNSESSLVTTKEYV